jgi:tetratricopeptide (TPR) repeat protein
MMPKYFASSPVRLTAAFLAVLALAGGALAAPAQEDDAAALLRQADGYYAKGDYRLAVGTYLEAAALSRTRLTQSAAYFGLAICYFYERDMANSVKWMRQTAQVDPNKEISESFYPRAFVDLYRSVREEVRVKGLPAGEQAAVVEPERPAVKAVEPPPADREQVREDPARMGVPGEAPRPKPRRTPRQDLEPSPLSLARLFKDGHWEINVHAGSWTIDPVLGLFKGRLLDELSEELQIQMVKKLGQTYSGLVKAVYTPSLELDSGGGNYGLELRYYNRGWAGTFSFGVSIEKTRIRLAMDGSAEQTFTSGAKASAEATAALETSPLSTNFGFRWELGRGRLKPFISLGFGFASFSGTATYAYSGTYQLGTIQDSFSDEDTQTFEELSESIDFAIPKNIIILQLGLGLKLDILKSLSLLGEAGIWDGLLLRGGLAYRF